MELKTRSDIETENTAAMLRARNPLIWIVTREEDRVERHLYEAAASANYITRFWDVAAGVTGLNGDTVPNIGGPDPAATLEAIRTRSKSGEERGVWVMRDLPVWLQGPPGATVLRQLRNLARALPGVEEPKRRQSVIVLTTDPNVPPELAGHATVIEWPLPDRAEIARVLDTAVERGGDKIEPLNGNRDAAIDAAVGLTEEEASACYAKSLVRLRKIDPVMVAAEKKRVIARERVLEWFDPLPGGLDAVGGLDGLKAWLKTRRSAYTASARAYGLPAPKGVLLVGVPGCGKSLTAKAIATAWSVPLLRLDLGALKSKFVGESEANLRKALNVIAAIGRCVVWLDEIEKALAGATQGAADGGVSADALGAVLNWMQERAGEAFVVATANKVDDLPPELMRKGRFDEIFFVDTPNANERKEILGASLRKHGRSENSIAWGESLIELTSDFTGSEVAELVPTAMFEAFADGERAIKVADLCKAAREVVPLAKTSKEKVDALRAWAKTRARPATLATEAMTERRKGGRGIDLD